MECCQCRVRCQRRACDAHWTYDCVKCWNGVRVVETCLAVCRDRRAPLCRELRSNCIRCIDAVVYIRAATLRERGEVPVHGALAVLRACLLLRVQPRRHDEARERGAAAFVVSLDSLLLLLLLLLFVLLTVVVARAAVSSGASSHRLPGVRGAFSEQPRYARREREVALSHE